MSEPPSGDLFGVLGPAGDVADAVSAAGGRVRRGDPETVLDASPDAVVAVGESALCRLATRQPAPTIPLLPVDAGPGLQSVPTDAVGQAVEQLLSGQAATLSCPVLGAHIDGSERARALTDVMLVTAEQARISEYAVYVDGEHVARFRADGVVVATPVGSHGYARSVDAPVVAAETGVLAVRPIAPFATDPDHWVVPTDDLALRVERDEAPVELLVDDRSAGTVPHDELLDVTGVASVDLLTVPASQPQVGVPADDC
jgi:NAD+ kinase